MNRLPNLFNGRPIYRLTHGPMNLTTNHNQSIQFTYHTVAPIKSSTCTHVMEPCESRPTNRNQVTTSMIPSNRMSKASSAVACTRCIFTIIHTRVCMYASSCSYQLQTLSNLRVVCADRRHRHTKPTQYIKDGSGRCRCTLRLRTQLTSGVILLIGCGHSLLVRS